MNCAKAAHPAFLIFNRKNMMILEQANEARTKQWCIKGVAYFRYIWYAMCGSMEVII